MTVPRFALLLGILAVAAVGVPFWGKDVAIVLGAATLALAVPEARGRSGRAFAARLTARAGALLGALSVTLGILKYSLSIGAALYLPHLLASRR